MGDVSSSRGTTPSATMELRPITRRQLTVIGIFGIPGSGKTFLLRQLKKRLPPRFQFFEGSEVIDSVVDGGLLRFQHMEHEDKQFYRELAMEKILNTCVTTGRAAVVTGHFMHWTEGDEAGQFAYTQKDLRAFTHVLYLDVDPDTVYQRRQQDQDERRPETSRRHLDVWQRVEKKELRGLCFSQSILFYCLLPTTSPDKITILLRDFEGYADHVNLERALGKLKSVLQGKLDTLETVLVLDADGTLAPDDTGKLLWNLVSDDYEDTHPLKAVFGGPQGHSLNAFRQATLLHEEVADRHDFDQLCREVALQVKVYPEVESLLELVQDREHIQTLVVTSGPCRLWETILEQEGLDLFVKVIGGGRIDDGFVVNAEVKKQLVLHMRQELNLYVWTFGDSVHDLPMMIAANRAIIMVGEESTRSKGMDAALSRAIDTSGLQAHQAVLPIAASPRLNQTRLPSIEFTSDEFIDSIICHRQVGPSSVLLALNDSAVQLLATPMRDAAVAGPALREAHRRTGWYLATEYVTSKIGVEEFTIENDEGYEDSGHRLYDEKRTLIVALMRGGEPMALGISDAFPLARFLHAFKPTDLGKSCLKGIRTVLLVDSVINIGEAARQYVKHIRMLRPHVRIAIVAGVVQDHAVAPDGILGLECAGDPNLTVIALRQSPKRFTCSEGIDNGNRLFNRSYLE